MYFHPSARSKVSELPVTAWVEWAPEGGWEVFDQSQELVEAIWQGLTEEAGQWHYMNITAQSSVWESCIDGSAIVMWHESGGVQRLMELKVSAGAASNHMVPVVSAFRLVPSPEAPAEHA